MKFFPALLLFLSITALILSGCAHQTSTPKILDKVIYQQKLTTLTRWNLNGKIAIRQTRHAIDDPSKQIKTNHSASLKWQQQNEHFTLFISGPLGVGATVINGSPKSLTLKNNQGETSTTHNPEQLLMQELGWSLPLTELSQWVLGVTPSLDSSRFNDDNTLAHFSQQDWLIEYDRYQIVDNFLLPEKIRLTYSSPQHTLRITLLIKQWEIN